MSVKFEFFTNFCEISKFNQIGRRSAVSREIFEQCRRIVERRPRYSRRVKAQIFRLP